MYLGGNSADKGLVSSGRNFADEEGNGEDPLLLVDGDHFTFLVQHLDLASGLVVLEVRIVLR